MVCITGLIFGLEATVSTSQRFVEFSFALLLFMRVDLQLVDCHFPSIGSLHVVVIAESHMNSRYVMILHDSRSTNTMSAHTVMDERVNEKHGFH